MSAAIEFYVDGATSAGTNPETRGWHRLAPESPVDIPGDTTRAVGAVAVAGAPPIFTELADYYGLEGLFGSNYPVDNEPVWTPPNSSPIGADVAAVSASRSAVGQDPFGIQEFWRTSSSMTGSPEESPADSPGNPDDEPLEEPEWPTEDPDDIRSCNLSRFHAKILPLPIVVDPAIHGQPAPPDQLEFKEAQHATANARRENLGAFQAGFQQARLGQAESLPTPEIAHSGGEQVTEPPVRTITERHIDTQTDIVVINPNTLPPPSATDTVPLEAISATLKVESIGEPTNHLETPDAERGWVGRAFQSAWRSVTNFFGFRKSADSTAKGQSDQAAA